MLHSRNSETTNMNELSPRGLTVAGLNQIKAFNFHPQIILPAASHNPLSNSNKIQPKTAREENLCPIFVAWEQGLNGSA